MIIDLNMGWFPENLFSDENLLNSVIGSVPRAYGEHAEVITIPGTNKRQIVTTRPKGYENNNCSEIFCDTKLKLEIMDEAKIDKAFLQVSVWQEWLNLEMSKKFNDGMAQCIREHPSRFLGLASVPPWGDKQSLDEIERCVKELGFPGVLCTAHYGKLYLDEEEFRPYFKKISELGVPILVHHTPLPVDYGSLCKYSNLRRFYGRCVDQVTSLGRILYSGLLDEFPNLKLIFTMLAGGFFTYVNLIAPQKSRMREDMERFDLGASEKIRGYLERNIYFDMTHASPWGKAQLECAVKVLGADHILFGGGYPVRREWLLTGVDFVRSLDITEEEKSLILGGNAVRLFNLK